MINPPKTNHGNPRVGIRLGELLEVDRKIVAGLALLRGRRILSITAIAVNVSLIR